MRLEKYSIGVGDRFGRQGKAQLKAIIAAKKLGINIVPVWNKSWREHSIIGSMPVDTRKAADNAVAAMNWDGPYHLDADHINMSNVEPFIEYCDFFTLDVAEKINTPANSTKIQAFIKDNSKFIGDLQIPGLDAPMVITQDTISQAAVKYLAAVDDAAAIYQHILSKKGGKPFIVEVSMDETDLPQSPVELFFILKMISDAGIPAQTIAPKFSGRFNKGVDYVGDAGQFEIEFLTDTAVIAYAVSLFSLPENLKLSVHSGSDKFSIYPSINRVLKKFNSGLHLKTAGTSWLEEVIGLSVSGDEALAIAKEIYKNALEHCQQLCAPYATVIDIDSKKLPSCQQVDSWDGKTFAAALTHQPGCPDFNPNLRQLIHVGYKIAASMGPGYLDALEKYETTIAPYVANNLLEKHIKPIFGNLNR